MAFKYSEEEYEKDKKKKSRKTAFIPNTNESPDRSYGGSGPGSLLDRNLKDYDGPYPSDKEYPSGTFPLAKGKKKTKKKTKKTRTA